MALAMLPKVPRTAYPDITDDQALVNAMFTDAIMGGPARWVAGQSASNPAWLYYFSYLPEARRGKVPGAGHASEIPFVFDTWDKLGALAGGIKPTAQDLAVTAVMHSCWVAFAKTGKPDCTGAPAWPAYTRTRDTLMDFDGAPPSVKTNLRKTQLDAQEAVVLPKLDVSPSLP